MSIASILLRRSSFRSYPLDIAREIREHELPNRKPLERSLEIPEEELMKS